MKDLFSSDKHMHDIQEMESFLREKIGNLRPKSGFQASLKDRLISSEAFRQKKNLGKAWFIGLGIALAGATFYGMGYLIYKNLSTRTV
jgi:hypothetical protein